MSAAGEEQPVMMEAVDKMATLDVIDQNVCMLTVIGQAGLDILQSNVGRDIRMRNPENGTEMDITLRSINTNVNASILTAENRHHVVEEWLPALWKVGGVTLHATRGAQGGEGQPLPGNAAPTAVRNNVMNELGTLGNVAEGVVAPGVGPVVVVAGQDVEVLEAEAQDEEAVDPEAAAAEIAEGQEEDDALIEAPNADGRDVPAAHGPEMAGEAEEEEDVDDLLEDGDVTPPRTMSEFEQWAAARVTGEGGRTGPRWYFSSEISMGNVELDRLDAPLSEHYRIVEYTPVNSAIMRNAPSTGLFVPGHTTRRNPGGRSSYRRHRESQELGELNERSLVRRRLF